MKDDATDSTRKHVMIDIETLSDPPNAVITEIAAVAFSEDHLVEPKLVYQTKIDIESAMDAGLNISAGTLKWWAQQEHFSEVVSGEIPLHVAIKAFDEVIADYDTVWAKSPIFDCALIRDAARACGYNKRWGFENRRRFRDVRTAIELNDEHSIVEYEDGTHHNPADDCKYQIAQLYNHLTFAPQLDALTAKEHG